MTNAMEYDNRSRDAVTGYYYFKFFDKDTESDKLYRFYVERDDVEYCCHPWKDDDGFLTTINVWWNRYALGHNEGGGDADNMLRELVEKYVSKDAIKAKVLAGEFHLRNKQKWYKLENDEDGYEYKSTYIGIDNAEHEYYMESEYAFIEDVLDSIGVNTKMGLLQTFATENIVIIPVYIYEHSGIAISTGSFGDPWDSGCAGFAYIEKDKYESMCGKDTWDTTLVRECIESEVHLYNQYLNGEVYMYCDEMYDEKADHFYSNENCGSFYSDKWGEKLAMELLNTMWNNPQLISEDKAREFIKEAQIMEQAEYGIAI